MYLNEKERSIIGAFMRNLGEYENHEMTMKWEDGSKIVALFDTCFEDEDDDTEEEFFSIAFTAISVFSRPPVRIMNGGGFLINYRNFPDEIIAGGKKIN